MMVLGRVDGITYIIVTNDPQEFEAFAEAMDYTEYTA